LIPLSRVEMEVITHKSSFVGPLSRWEKEALTPAPLPSGEGLGVREKGGEGNYGGKGNVF
jgi:hypothetical protein